ncbi:MAG TPA: phospholipase D-like domain-containing protein [Phycisphaerales bacterium]|nr:phospholipase D-like domain-containing protein [Phycisphaerales bacterium]
MSRQLLFVVLAAVSVSLAGALGGCTAGHYTVESRYAVDDPQFARTMGNLLGPPIVAGNEVVTLVNGDQIFPAMLDAIRSARTSITFETFIFWSGDIGHQFTEAIAERAAAGVKVHIIIDVVGSKTIDAAFMDRLTKAGAEVELYHTFKLFQAVDSARKLNNRTHRKLLVVDGTVAFTGGVGIADEWSGNAQDPRHWRDNHYQVRGPVVAQLQAAFMDDWMESTGEVLHDGTYFPPLAPAGSLQAQLFKSSFRGGNDSMHLMYLLSFAASRRSIRLATPYFLPDDTTIATLLAARERGVEIDIILPGEHIDDRFVRHASRSSWGDLLRAGVRIYEYQPTMYHVKLMIVDDLWCSVGSSNLDPRSFGINCEANLNVLDAAFAGEQTRLFEDDMSRCKEITYDEWNSRGLGERLWEIFVWPFRSQM